MCWVQVKRKKNHYKTTIENMLVVFTVQYQNILLKVSCRTRALKDYRAQTAIGRYRFLAHRVCHADSEETGEHSGSEIQQL